MELLARAYPYYMVVFFSVWSVLVARAFVAAGCLPAPITRRDVVAVACIVLAGIVLRISCISHIDMDPYGWRFMRDAVTIKNTLTTGVMDHSPLPLAIRVPGYSFLAALSFLFWGSDSLRAVSASGILFSALTIVLLYCLAFHVARERFAAVAAASMLALSGRHVMAAGQEIPLSDSIFFVTLSMLLFILWEKSGRRVVFYAWWASFLMALNIKPENIIFLPVFLVFIKGGWDKLGPDRKQISTISALMTLVTLLFMLPFVKNLAVDQWAVVIKAKSAYAPLDLRLLFKNVWEQVICVYYGYPLLMAAGFVMASHWKEWTSARSMMMVWLGCALMMYAWWGSVPGWYTLIVLMPVFIMNGDIIAIVLRWLMAGPFWRGVVLGAYLIVLAVHASSQAVLARSEPWFQAQERLAALPEGQCMVSLGFETSGFALPFLFPQIQWFFVSEQGMSGDLSHCVGDIGFFDPVPYGMEEEIEPERLFFLRNKARGFLYSIKRGKGQYGS